PYYDHKQTAKLCARTNFSSYPDRRPFLLSASAPLANFIVYFLHQTSRLHTSVVFAATLAVLQCLQARFPAARGSSGHRLI
ncbi:uncharacterized protein BXZ73DRAFT_33781, partial [Epithele typhae]|uniref:uncharacterized protein n=1 Tax=Epithele typhae TaxID=378194 RepID=UPI0020074699